MLLANYLIGLREGLEASLVVSILVSFLVTSGHRERIRYVWFGTAGAIGLAVLGWAILAFVQSLTAHSFFVQELVGGLMSLVAVAFVTWMIFWMRSASRTLKRELGEKLSEAVKLGAWSVALLAFLAVFREGIETAFIVYASASGTTSVQPFIGVVLGIATSVALGYLIYRGAIRVNLGVFFRWTGALLILVAAGIFAYGFHDLQEAGVLPGLNQLAFDISSAVPPTSWYGVLLKGIFNFNPAPTVIELAAWLVYLIPVMVVFLLPSRPKPPVKSESATVPAASS